MSNDKDFFGSLREFSGGSITLADGQKTKIAGEGSGVIHGVDGSGKVARIEVNNAKYVPGLSTNLISVTKLAEKNFRVNFDVDGCAIIDAEDVVVATGSRHGGLYYLRMAEGAMAASESVHKVDCQHQWHRRLGHRDWAAAERIIKEELATGIRVSDCGQRVVCECCMEGKSARLPFPPVVDRKSSHVLDIVHTDLCGPMDIVTPSENRYVMTITDDYSRFAVTYLLKQKNEAAGNIKDYVRWVSNIFGRKPRVVRSDGGGEFDNRELRSFYKSEGIQPQFTTPYSPQQNGVAKRKNRSLIEMATCMLIDAGLEKRYWSEAMLTATYLQNRLSSRSIQTTPYQMWWNRKPNLSHLRVFGSQAYVHVPDTRRKKLDSKATKLTFVGYAMEQKGYRFVDLETDQVTISRDARFIELENGTSSVEVTIPRSKKPEEEIKLLPLKEKKEEKDDPFEESISAPEDLIETDDGDEVGEPVASSTVRRSERSNRGALPKHFDVYELDYVADIAACAVEEPVGVKEALADPVWRKAMEEELEAHRINGTWQLVKLPEGRKVIGSRWVYKTKKNEENRVVKFKARLVAQGYAQRYGVDVGEVFAPVTTQATFRTFLTVAAKHNMIVQHLDIKTAYLHGTLEEEVYMRQPPGYVKAGNEELVCRLQRSIYGLRQSARCWNKRLHEVLVKNGFKAAVADPCLYIRGAGKTKVLLLVYVDDLLLASTNATELKIIQEQLNAEFELTNLGEVRHFLGVEVRREGTVFKIGLRNYIDELLQAHGMNEAKPVKSPMEPGYLKLTDSGKSFDDQTSYRSLVGGLLYRCCKTGYRSVRCNFGKKVLCTERIDWTAAKRVLRFLKKTRSYQLQLGGAVDQPLVGFSDADWAGDAESRRSTSGMVFQFGGGTISWASLVGH